MVIMANPAVLVTKFPMCLVSVLLGNCTKENIKIMQTQVSRGKHPRWKMVVLSTCDTCEASIVEVACPGWVEPKAIEGYMYPVELVDKDLCILGAPISSTQPFSYVYKQHLGKINLTVSLVKYSCPN